MKLIIKQLLTAVGFFGISLSVYANHNTDNSIDRCGEASSGQTTCYCVDSTDCTYGNSNTSTPCCLHDGGLCSGVAACPGSISITTPPEVE